MKNPLSYRLAVMSLWGDSFEQWLKKQVGGCPRWERAFKHVAPTDIRQYLQAYLADQLHRYDRMDAPNKPIPATQPVEYSDIAILQTKLDHYRRTGDSEALNYILAHLPRILEELTLMFDRSRRKEI